MKCSRPKKIVIECRKNFIEKEVVMWSIKKILLDKKVLNEYWFKKNINIFKSMWF